jgi:hypothetical protein
LRSGSVSVFQIRSKCSSEIYVFCLPPFFTIHVLPHKSQGGSHLDRGSQYVLHLADVNGGLFPPSQTVNFIANTSHQDFAMMSANSSLYWLFVNDYNQRYPDINATNPGDGFRYHPPKPKKTRRAYATHGNIVLATSLLSGSLLFVMIFFASLPFIFLPNYIEAEREDHGVYGTPLYDVKNEVTPYKRLDRYM